MKITVGTMLAVCWLVASGQVVGSEQSSDSWANYALITAKPVSARSLSKSEPEESAGRIEMSSIYRVRLRDIDVVYGTLNQSSLSVDLSASQARSITSNKQIFLLLKLLNGQVSEVLYWGVPTTIVCVPDRIVVERAIAGDFYEFDMLDGRKCTNAKWFN